MKHIELKVFCVLSFCFFITCGLDKTALGVPNPQIDLQLKTGDAHYRLRDDLSEADLALSHYQKALKHNPNRIEALWKVSMACHFLGMRNSDEEVKQKYFQQGIEAAEKSVELNPACGPCHFWLGINKALLGESVGIFKMLGTLSAVEEHLKKSAELAPEYAEGGSFRILGIINQKVPRLFGGSREEAIKFFEKAIATVPKEPMNYLFLVKLLAEDEDNLEKAIELTEKGLHFPVPPTEYVESREARVELENLKQSLDRKMESRNPT